MGSTAPKWKVWLFLSFNQVLVELAELQDREVGDGTTSVVIIAAELLKVSAVSDSSQRSRSCKSFIIQLKQIHALRLDLV